ncbi:exodeoxyribonuclease VII large subunit [Deminuibacter soli]|nr:exodeoxyribonuclease VII large subunit [Deminuibacter soli]
MAEDIHNKRVFSLFEVAKSIQKTIMDRYTSSYWVKAEMNKLNYYSHSGHCYPELVEKSGGKVVAQLKANLWRDDFKRINEKFTEVVGEPLKDGIKILLLATLSFDPAYGLALRIIDIDPGFTLGDLEQEKANTIARLKKEGLFHQNKSLSLPLLPQRIALISVETSKGYADFLNVLTTNIGGYAFFHFLFPSLLQGEQAVKSILQQLQRIKKVQSHFDVVAIIRGGGGDVGLSCYNNYELAKEIALFPIPVITGIGHATNETVVEMVSFSNAITPTKIAEYLIQQFHNFSVPVQKAEEKIKDKALRLLNEQQTQVTSVLKLFRSVTQNVLVKNRSAVDAHGKSIIRQADFLFKSERNEMHALRSRLQRGAALACDANKQAVKLSVSHLQKDVAACLMGFKFGMEKTAGLLHHASKLLVSKNQQELKHDQQLLVAAIRQQADAARVAVGGLEKEVRIMSPENVLMRGYSITLRENKAVGNSQQVKKGDVLTTILYQGVVTSVVETSEKNTEA